MTFRLPKPRNFKPVTKPCECCGKTFTFPNYKFKFCDGCVSGGRSTFHSRRHASRNRKTCQCGEPMDSRATRCLTCQRELGADYSDNRWMNTVEPISAAADQAILKIEALETNGEEVPAELYEAAESEIYAVASRLRNLQRDLLSEGKIPTRGVVRQGPEVKTVKTPIGSVAGERMLAGWA